MKAGEDEGGAVDEGAEDERPHPVQTSIGLKSEEINFFQLER